MRKKMENILRNQEPDRNKLSVVWKEQTVPHNTVHCSGNENTSVATECRAHVHWRYQGFPDQNSDKSGNWHRCFLWTPFLVGRNQDLISLCLRVLLCKVSFWTSFLGYLWFQRNNVSKALFWAHWRCSLNVGKALWLETWWCSCRMG